MNPHFIFNALQSIQDFIFSREQKEANKYLVKFSRLMRLLLESSKEKYISLDQEINLLEYYVELEHLRFSEKFEYTFDIDSSLDLNLTQVPTMLLQPFIENAINHGLLYKEEKGLLKLHFDKIQDRIKITIEDNGVGRKKATEIRQKTKPIHKSRSMQIIEERMHLRSLEKNANIDINVTDLYNEVNEPAGTKVVVLINQDFHNQN